MESLKVQTNEELEIAISKAESPAEQMKIIAWLKSDVDAYCTAYKDTLRDQILAEESNNAAVKMAGAGHQIVEAKIKRIGQGSDEYKNAAQLYQEAKRALSFLTSYTMAIKMKHESNIAKEYRLTAELKANTFATGG